MIYLVFIVLFLIIYIIINYICISIFNKGKRQFLLKKPNKFRLADNYIYGNRLDPSADGSLNCTTADNKLIECDIDENNQLGRNAMCAQCKQISARCVHIKEPVYSADDPNKIIIEPNSSPEKGYCLPAKTTTNSCTRRNGGKWILSTVEDTVEADPKNLIYTFECYCSTPQFFQADSGGDCTRFIGCRNGHLTSESWSSYEDMTCTCPSDLYEEKPGSANEPPSCIPLNIYRRGGEHSLFEILDPQFVDNTYKMLLNGDRKVNLPNPCTFDLTTKTYVRGIGKVVWDSKRKIAYCQSTNSNYMTAIMNDDYLFGNGGKYANAMFRYRIKEMDESNDDADDCNNRYENAVVYEVFRKGARVETLSGIRIPYSNFTIYLPYLEKTSYNMGSTLGRRYTNHPNIPALRQQYAFVYVFEADTPNHKVDILIGSTIQYIPAFMSTSFESSYRVYNGAIPCVNVSENQHIGKRGFWIMYPTPPGSQYKNKLGKQGIMGDLIRPNVESDKFTSGYGFPMVYDDQVQVYTELFTGTIFTYTFNNKVYSRPVSCGDILLTSKYRRNYDPNWINRPLEEIKGYSPSKPFQFAVTSRDGHMFTRNSYDIERNEIGVTKRKISRYELGETGGIVFKAFYS